MYARLTSTTLGPGQTDESGAVFAELLPTLRTLDGFKGMVILSEVDGREVHALSFWESAQALEEGAATMDRLRDAETSARDVEGQTTSEHKVVGFDFAS